MKRRLLGTFGYLATTFSLAYVWLLVESAYFALQFTLVGLVFALLGREGRKEAARAL